MNEFMSGKKYLLPLNIRISQTSEKGVPHAGPLGPVEQLAPALVGPVQVLSRRHLIRDGPDLRFGYPY